MANIIGVRFQARGNIFYCDTGDIQLQAGDMIVVDTDHGPNLAKVTIPKAHPRDIGKKPLLPLIRHAQPEDLEQARQDREKEAADKCSELINQLGLKMKLLSAHYEFSSDHLTIFFGAKERVDFRNLVRKLSHSLKIHVELRQIGPRDEAKLLGGIGKCGYPLCCQSFLTGFTPVSIKMAKQQQLSLSPMKISGICGRLLCCLSYENKQYSTIKEKMPQEGKEISTPFGRGQVISTNLLKELVIVKLLDSDKVKEIPLSEINHE